MTRAPRPKDDGRRVAALRALEILDTEPEERFDRITRTAARLLDAPMAMISFVDAERQWPKSSVGLPGDELPRDLGFCSHTILAAGPQVIPDLAADPRFADLPGVASGALRAYAGHPVRALTGERVGTLCVIDDHPRAFDATQVEALRDLAGWVEAELVRNAADDAIRGVQRSETSLWTLIDCVGEAIVTFAADGVVRFGNRTAEDLFAAKPGGLVDTDFAALVPGTDWRRLAAVPDPAIVEDGTTTLGRPRLVTGRRRDGQPFPLLLAVNAALLDGERIFIAVGRDVEAEQASDAARRRSDDRFRLMFENTSLGVVSIDITAGLVVDVNQAMADLLGASADELRGEGFWSIGHSDDREDDEAMFAALRSGEIDRVRREQRYVRRDGTVKWGRLNLSVLWSEDGQTAYGIGVFEDITERRAAERMKDEFVSVVGHELRTPLTSIRGSLGLLHAGVFGPLPDEAADMLTLAVTNTDRLVRLINDMLDLERMDAGRMELQIAPVPAAEIVTTAVQAVQASADAADVALRVEVAKVTVNADADRVVQALVNLLGNAVKFSPPGAEVLVTVVAEGRKARFSVRDAGRGIPPDQRESIFERFQQVDGSDAREKGGTGLGLPIARAIVERHGGHVWVEDVGDQPGALLSFTLPASRDLALLLCAGSGEARERDIVAELADVAPALRAETVLVVEDDPTLGEVLLRTIQSAGVPVQLVGTAQDAVAAIRTSAPAAIVLDLLLPGDDGFSVVDRLRGEGRLADVPVIVYTALDLGAAERERLQLGHTEFLTKAAASPADVERRVVELLGAA